MPNIFFQAPVRFAGRSSILLGLLVALLALPLQVHAQSAAVCGKELVDWHNENRPKSTGWRWGDSTLWEDVFMFRAFGTVEDLRHWLSRFSPCRNFEYTGLNRTLLLRVLANGYQVLGRLVKTQAEMAGASVSELQAARIESQDLYHEAYLLWKKITDSPYGGWDRNKQFILDNEFRHFLEFRLEDDARLAAHLDNMVRRYDESLFYSEPPREFHETHGNALLNAGRYVDAQAAFRREAERLLKEGISDATRRRAERISKAYWRAGALLHGMDERCPGGTSYRGEGNNGLSADEVQACVDGPYMPLPELAKYLLIAAETSANQGNYQRGLELMERFWRLQPDPPFVTQENLDTLRFNRTGRNDYFLAIWRLYAQILVLGQSSTELTRPLNRALSEVETWRRSKVNGAVRTDGEWAGERHTFLMIVLEYLEGQNRNEQARQYVDAQIMNSALSLEEQIGWKLERARLMAKDGNVEKALAHLVVLDDEAKSHQYGHTWRRVQILHAQILANESRNVEALSVLDEIFPSDWINHQVDETHMQLLVLRAQLAAREEDSARLDRYVSELEGYFKRNNASCNFCPQLRALLPAGG